MTIDFLIILYILGALASMSLITFLTGFNITDAIMGVLYFVFWPIPIAIIIFRFALVYFTGRKRSQKILDK